MILVYGQADDPSISGLVQALQAVDAAYVYLDTSTLDQASLDISVGPPGVSGALVVAGQALPLQDIRAVYARPSLPPVLDGAVLANAHAFALHQQLLDWLDIAPVLVVSRPAAVQANASKPLQIQRMGEAGFRSQHGRVMFSSISDGEAGATELDDAGLSRMHRLTQLPTQFQAHVPGVDVCVHVVGDQVFAAEAGRDARWGTSHLPEVVATQCVAMSRAMGLPLACIDLRRRPDGAYVCFEVHPMPAYSNFEVQSGLPLAAALADLLQAA